MLLGSLLQLLRNQNRNVLQSTKRRDEVFVTVQLHFKREKKGRKNAKKVNVDIDSGVLDQTRLRPPIHEIFWPSNQLR